MPRVRRPLALVSCLLLAVVLVACGGEDLQPDVVEWRNVSLDVPDDWYVFERSERHLSMANADLSPREEDEEFDAPDGDVVRMAFTYEPGTTPDDWREFVEQQDATLETDQAITLDEDVPATQLVFRYTTLGTDTREMVVVIPSRAIVVLSQPVPGPEDDAPEVFLDHIETFLAVLETADFGRPVMDEE